MFGTTIIWEICRTREIQRINVAPLLFGKYTKHEKYKWSMWHHYYLGNMRNTRNTTDQCFTTIIWSEITFWSYFFIPQTDHPFKARDSLHTDLQVSLTCHHLKHCHQNQHYLLMLTMSFCSEELFRLQRGNLRIKLRPLQKKMLLSGDWLPPCIEIWNVSKYKIKEIQIQIWG